jgi:signal transduction histidine kinase
MWGHMRRSLPAIALVGGGASFGAAGLSLALLGLGVPFLLGALLAAICAGLLIYAAGRWALERDLPAEPKEVFDTDLEERIRVLEESSAHLRHDLRGVLSPALMMADRLLRNDDPAIRRAGQAVVRSVERATALLAENKKANGTAIGEDAPDAQAPPAPRHTAETDAQSS